jgi:hypothetical protein
VIEDLITSVEFSVSDPNIAYACGDSTFYRSEDGGRSWRIMAGGQPLLYYGPPGARTGFPIDLQVDPRDPNRVFINNYGGGAFLSKDGGRTWRSSSQGYTGALVNDVAVDPTDPLRVYSLSIGPFVSSNGGADWAGLGYDDVSTVTRAIALDPSSSQHLLISEQHQGVIFSSTDADFIG